MLEIVVQTKKQFDALKKLIDASGHEGDGIIAIWKPDDEQKKKTLKDTNNLWCDLQKFEVD